jgi:hypothetical protein
VCAALVTAFLAGSGWFTTRPVAGQETKEQTLQGAAALDRLKQDGQYDSLQAAMNQARFGVGRAERTPLGRAAWHAPNPAAGYDAYVTEDGVSIAINDKTIVSLSLRGVGYGDALEAVAPGEVSGDKQTINLAREGGVREWSVNGPDGLEHCFTLSEPPGARQKGMPLRLALQVSNGWRAVASEDGKLVTLLGPRDEAVEYSKLVVRDSLGRNIPARLTVADGQVVIEAEDGEATYPLTIDPLFSLQKRLLAADGATGDSFGYAVELSGNTAVISAPLDDVTSADQGSVYVFARSGATWTLQQKLTANDGAAHDQFGWAVALDGDTLAVSAPFDTIGTNSGQGSAYIFVRSGATWAQQQKIMASDGAANDFFGFSIALSGDTLVAGAYFDTIGANGQQGSAYVFKRSGANWAPQQKLNASDGAGVDFFGFAVAIDGDTLAVGAIGDTIGPSVNRGSVYVFTRSGSAWTQKQKITASDGATGDNFGCAVALSGDTMAVGAFGDNLGAQPYQGSVYVFTRQATVWANWTEQQKLTAGDSATAKEFGRAVALSGDTLAIGAWDNAAGPNQYRGLAYIFAREGATWAQHWRLSPANGQPSDNFGCALALDGDTALVGASGTDSSFADQGAAYVFTARWDVIDQQRIIASDGAADDYFGEAVALDGDTLVVGVKSDDIGANNAQGSAYIFTRSGATWTQQQKLIAADGEAPDMFGSAVALNGDTLVIGACGDKIGANEAQGSIYVFTRQGATWTQQQKLVAPDGMAQDFFGEAIALSGDTLVIGVPRSDINNNQSQGAAYVFTRQGTAWTQPQKLTANDGLEYDYFGDAVAVDGDTLVVGASANTTPGGFEEGSAYVFKRQVTGWSFQQQLIGDVAPQASFGRAVAIDGDIIVVGAPNDSFGPHIERGSAHVFKRSGAVWNPQQKLFILFDAEAKDHFGSAVALSNDTLVIGAPDDKVDPNLEQGSAYVFTFTGSDWWRTQTLTASDGAAHDTFGRAVALSGDTILVGAPGNTIGNNHAQGSVYVFVSQSCPALTFTPDILPAIYGGVWYEQQLTVSGGWGAYQFALSGGALPPGLTLTQNGLLSGASGVPGAYNFTISATNTYSLCSESRPYSIDITPCHSITIDPKLLPDGLKGRDYRETLVATGGKEPYTFRAEGALPKGLSMSDDGVLSGTPLEEGSFSFRVMARDAVGCVGIGSYTLTIQSTGSQSGVAPRQQQQQSSARRIENNED